MIRLRAVEAGSAVLAMVRTAAAMAKSRRRYAPSDIAAHEELITGSWRPLVYRNPDVPEGQLEVEPATRRARSRISRQGEGSGNGGSSLLSAQQKPQTCSTPRRVSPFLLAVVATPQVGECDGRVRDPQDPISAGPEEPDP